MLRSWRHLLTATSLPSLLAVFLIWLVPESPKWLLAVGRTREAEEVVRSIVKENGRELPKGWKLEQAGTWGIKGA